MSTLEIMGTVYQVEQRGQYRDEESLGQPARPLVRQPNWLCCSMGEMLIRLGEKLKGQAERPLPLPPTHVTAS
jgi:hypothetical protein